MQLQANGDCILSGTALSLAFRTKYCDVVAARFGALKYQSLLRDLTPYSFSILKRAICYLNQVHSGSHENWKDASE
jgi:hypothetical protein